MKGIILYLLVFTSHIVFSQFTNVIEGDIYNRSKNEAFNGFIGESKNILTTVDYIYTTKKKKNLFIRKFNKNNLNIIEEKDIFSNMLEDHTSDPFEIFSINEKIYLFSIHTPAKEGYKKIGLSIFDEFLELEKFQLIDEFENNNEVNSVIQLSQDSTAFILAKNYKKSNIDKEVITLNCLDFSGESQWKKELISLNDVHNVNLENVIFLNNNEAFLLCNFGYKNPNSDNVETKLLSNKYSIWAYNHKLNYLKEIDLRLKLKWINGIELKVKPNGHLVVAGFINSSRTFAVNSLFRIEIDRKYEIIKNHYAKIKLEDVKLFLPAGSKRKALENMYLRNVSIQNDGSCLLVGEQYYKYLDRVYDPRTNTTNTTEHYNYEYILVAKLNDEGELNWVKRIPKVQNSTNDYGYYSSFTTFHIKDDLYLIYNDYDKNLELPIEDVENLKPLYNGRRGKVVYVKINNDGAEFRKSIPMSYNFSLYSKKSVQINAEKLYMLTEQGKKSKIIGLEF